MIAFSSGTSAAGLRERPQPFWQLSVKMPSPRPVGIPRGDSQGGLPGPGVAEGGFLEIGQFPDSLFGEGQLAVEFCPFERFAFGGPLDFYEFADTRHDDVEVDLGLAVFGVFEIEEGFSVMDADTDGGDVRLEDGAVRFGEQGFDRLERVEEGDEASGDAEGARPAVGFEDIAVDVDRTGAEGFHVDDGAQGASDESLDLGGPSIDFRASIALLSGGGAAGKHVVFGSDPTPGRILHPLGQFQIDRGGAEDRGPSGLDQHAPRCGACEVSPDR